MPLIPESSIDRRLLRAAAKYATPQEMSEAVLGQLSPAQCADRLNQLLESKSQLDEVQERRLLLIQMAEHLDWLKSKRENPDSWGALNRAYKLLSDQIERTNINVADVSSKLASKYAEYFVTAYSMGFDKALELFSKHAEVEIELDAEVIEEISTESIKVSQGYLQKVTARDGDGG